MKKDQRQTGNASFPQWPLTPTEQDEIVAACNQFKRAVQRHAGSKKELMKTCFAYIKNKFVGNDLLPIPSSIGNERDNSQSRPQIFIPLARQQLKMIFSQLKLTIFPNDQDYFRVRAKSSQGVPDEDTLTEGLKYIFKEAKVSEKLGSCLYNMIWSGCFIAQPLLKETATYEWRYEPDKQIENDSATLHFKNGFSAEPVSLDPSLDVESLNPLNFYIDPQAGNAEQARWVSVGHKKLQEMLDSELYFNKDRLPYVSAKYASGNDSQGPIRLDTLNDFYSQMEDGEEHVRYDLYYFPTLKTASACYRNVIVGVAGEQVLVRFHPNLFPKGLNPVVFCGWMADTDNPYSIGPIEDLLDIQKAINILWNYKLEVLARAGNRFAVRPGVDLNQFFGVAGGVAVTEDPRGDIVNFSGDYAEIATIDNAIGVLKAEGQLVTGAQNPFQGSSGLDYQKTATELQIIQENSISVIREIIEHISIMGIQRVLERLMYLAADLYTAPVEVAIHHPTEGRRFQSVDFSLLKSGEFTIELVSVNPSQSKQAQINGLLQLLELIQNDPNALVVGEPVIEKIGDLVGVKNIRDLLTQIKERLKLLR